MLSWVLSLKGNLKTIWNLLIVWMGICELPCFAQPSLRRGSTEVLVYLMLGWWCLFPLKGCRQGAVTSNDHPGLSSRSRFPTLLSPRLGRGLAGLRGVVAP